MQAFREIQALRHLHHENVRRWSLVLKCLRRSPLQIICMREVFPHGSALVFVFDYMITDLSELIKDYETPLTEKQIKAYMVQLLSGVAYMHETGIMHRVSPLSVSVFIQRSLSEFSGSQAGQPFGQQQWPAEDCGFRISQTDID